MARIPIGECRLVCNPPTNFQRCMVNIFFAFVETIGEILFSDFVTCGTSVDHYLYNLTKILQRCKEIDLMLNWEIFPFMIRQKTIFGKKKSEKGISLDELKVEIIEKLPRPQDVRGLNFFLGHASFYRKFIKNFAKMAVPLTVHLEIHVPFFPLIIVAW
jgi:hypothetical protein